MTGPTLRAAGMAYDNRKLFPYSSYEEFEFDVPTRTDSDCFGRYMIRVAEMRESLKIVRQAMAKITDEGPIRTEAPGIIPPEREKMKTEMEALIYHFKIFTEGFSPPPGEAFVAVESPRGELGCFHCQRRLAKAAARAFPLAVVHQFAGAAEDDRGAIDRRRDCLHRHDRYRARRSRPVIASDRGAGPRLPVGQRTIVPAERRKAAPSRRTPRMRTIMELTPQLAARFEKLQNRYPVKRSALIPMMMYAQDEYGFVSDEMIAEIAGRLDLRTVQVEETLAYYSMLHRKPMGKHHVQICTNVACMLRGGAELLEHAKKRLEIGHKEVTSDGVFSLEEVECIGACTGAPAMQVNYDFYENLTPLKFDRIIEDLDAGRKPAPEPVTAGALHPRDPAETPVISRRWGIKDSHKIDVYLQHDGYQALEKALKEMTPASIIDEVKKSNLRGRGGAGFPTGMKWSFVPKDSPKPKYVICNADESEPGTCKDRPLMEMDPHQLIEGIAIAGRAIGAHMGFIYIRGEYRYVLDIVQTALEEAYCAAISAKIFSAPALISIWWFTPARALTNAAKNPR